MGGGAPPVSQDLRQKVDGEVKRMVDEQLKRGRFLLNSNMYLMDMLADALLEKEKVNGDELMKMVNKAAAEGKGVVVTKKVTNKDRVYKPGKSLAKQTLTKDFRRVAKSLKGTVSGTFYRPDLEKAALAKWSLIHASQKKK